MLAPFGRFAYDQPFSFRMVGVFTPRMDKDNPELILKDLSQLLSEHKS